MIDDVRAYRATKIRTEKLYRKTTRREQQACRIEWGRRGRKGLPQNSMEVMLARGTEAAAVKNPRGLVDRSEGV
jgi:tRNA A37 threonylcarbamoyladenosine biosynthesis protein TsaE